MEKLKIPTVDNLHKVKDKQTKKKQEIYTKILKKCIDEIIKKNKTTTHTYLIFDVPIVLIETYYNLEECILFIINKLKHKGYKVIYTYPNKLYIDWGEKERIDLKKMNFKKI